MFDMYHIKSFVCVSVVCEWLAGSWNKLDTKNNMVEVCFYAVSCLSFKFAFHSRKPQIHLFP